MTATKERSSVDVTGSWFLSVVGPLVLLLTAIPAAFFDRPFARLINPDAPAPLDGLAVWIDAWSTRTALAALLGLGILSLAVERARRLRVYAATLLVSYAVEEVVVSTLKSLVGRLRPIIADGLGADLRAIVATADTRSFPSGHAAVATICAVVVASAVRHPLVRALAFVFAAMVSLGRCYAAVHHLSDILAGAGIGWGIAVVMHHAAWRYRWPLEDWRFPRRVWPLTFLVAIVVASYFAGQKIEPTDAKTGAIAVDLAMGSTAGMRLRTLFEPFMGFGVKISGMPDLDRLAKWSVLWGGLSILALFFFMKSRRGAAMIVALVAIAVLSVNVVVALSPVPRQTEPVTRGGDAAAAPVVTATLHFHFGDPYDAKSTKLDQGLDRARALGFDFVQATYHNDWTPAYAREGKEWRKVEVYAMEWTPGPLHLLVYNRKPEPANLAKRTLAEYADLIRDVHAAGGVVVAAHHWRWEKTAMPSPEDLVLAGIDGFEIENRSDEYAPEAISRRSHIRDLVREKGLLALGSNDDHGRRNFNYVWMRLDRGEKTVPVEDVVWGALTKRTPEFRIVTLVTDGPKGWPHALWPPAILVQYFREMRVPERVSWMVWIGMAALAANVMGRARR